MTKAHLPVPSLSLVTDRDSCLGRPREGVIGEAVGAGVKLVQLREKGLATRELFELGLRLIRPIHEAGALLMVNDRVDIALAIGADGVQLGGGSFPVIVARRLAGSGLLLGVSVHSVEEAVAAEREGADYLLLGTIFATASHPGRAPAGPVIVERVAGAVRIPVVAIGGIDAGNARQLMEIGASGVAVIRAIQSAPDVAAAARALREAVERG
jgi:thiamine-phosphate pyrophosphorylase